MTSVYLSKKSIKVVLWVAVIGFIVEVGGYFYGLQLSDIIYRHGLFESDKNKLESSYEIKFESSLSADDYPKDWGVDEVFDDDTVIAPSDSVYDQARFVRALKQEITKYPIGSLFSELKAIYILNKIILEGAGAGGRYSLENKSIYLLNRTNSYGLRIPKFIIKQTFHHEISSILMDAYNFDHDLWRSAHGQDFQYEIDKNPAYYWMYVRDHIASVDGEDLLERGMIRQYAETGVENDFNIYAEMVFTNPRRMKKLISEYPIIQRKYEVFKNFYLSIDKGFAPVFAKIDG